jgi:hypothetical protein
LRKIASLAAMVFSKRKAIFFKGIIMRCEILKRITRNLIPIIFFPAFFLNSCVTPPDQSGKATPAPSPNPKFIGESKNWASHDKRPEWSIKEPFNENNNLLFVGLSDKFMTEKEARADAQNTAIKNVVKYVGTDVVDKFRNIQTSYGLSTDIFDPIKAQSEFEEQFSSAVARKVKAKEWYIEKWEKKYENYSEYYFVVFLLAQVPQAEVDTAIKDQIEQREKIAQMVKSVIKDLSIVNNLLSEGSQTAASRPVQAFSKYSEAEINLNRLKSEIRIYPDLEKFANTVEGLASNLNQRQNELLKNPETKFRIALINLAGIDTEKPITIAVAGAYFESTKLSGKFGEYLKNKMEEILTGEPYLYKVISQKVFQNEISKNKILIEDCLSGKFGKSLLFSSLKGLLFANYWENDDLIEIKFDLLEIGSGRLINSISTNLPKNNLPKDIEFKPSNLEVVKEGYDFFSNTNKANKDFNIKVWPDKGESSIYKEGEIVKFNFRSNKDCYVYLYHVDSTGQVIMIFPNRYNKSNFIKANQVYTIPDPSMNFNFKIALPFGSEMVKAIASLQPIPDIDTRPNNELFRNIGKISDRNVKNLFRSIVTVEKEGKTEDVCVFTTMQNE